MEKSVQPVRLNIGCGSRYLDGWTNIDIVKREAKREKYKGKQPDIIGDIRDIPLEDNSVDEAMAIHVIEHFYVWEVPNLLREWVRILKPGGKLIIEVPDLEKVVSYMAHGVKDKTLTFWPLYGNPESKDPLMLHKWGYTMKSLGHILELVGLENIEREAAQFHYKEVRDMRMTATKCFA